MIRRWLRLHEWSRWHFMDSGRFTHWRRVCYACKVEQTRSEYYGLFGEIESVTSAVPLFCKGHS